ncbi:hypothetical protein HDV00_010711 [Rhizophlyctis rosea]|nr:hypothetical protein HDV00_010711 [Rhizophlyctis rosea]
MPTLLITILGVVMSLLLAFRTNTAYDRYWEGRRLWGTLLTQTRNLQRFIWGGITPKDDKTANERLGAMNLTLAFPIATKHYLRDEHGFRYEDLRPLVQHLPGMEPGAPETDIQNLPLEISYHLAAYVRRCRSLNLIDAAQFTPLTNSISALIDTLTSFERIRNTPMPLAYNVHLKQSLMLYILSLPFQLVSTLKWGTIPVMFVASFTLLGIEGIGGEIENPFGYDDNDLPVEVYCEDARGEMERVMEKDGGGVGVGGTGQGREVEGWGKVVFVGEKGHATLDMPTLRRRH